MPLISRLQNGSHSRVRPFLSNWRQLALHYVPESRPYSLRYVGYHCKLRLSNLLLRRCLVDLHFQSRKRCHSIRYFRVIALWHTDHWLKAIALLKRSCLRFHSDWVSRRGSSPTRPLWYECRRIHHRLLTVVSYWLSFNGEDASHYVRSDWKWTVFCLCWAVQSDWDLLL